MKGQKSRSNKQFPLDPALLFDAVIISIVNCTLAWLYSGNGLDVLVQPWSVMKLNIKGKDEKT
jgi:hypothetical protein